MKSLLSLFLFLTFSKLLFTQQIYRNEKVLYDSVQQIYEFYLYDDSTCFLKEYNTKYSYYSLFKGQLKRTKDTLFEFKFQPVARFGGHKRASRGRDTLSFSLEQKDTTLPSMSFNVRTEKGRESTVILKKGWGDITIEGSEEQNFSIDTKFIDPTDQQPIFINVDPRSGPGLHYYGTKTGFSSIQISMVKNKLMILPDNNYFHYDIKILTKK